MWWCARYYRMRYRITSRGGKAKVKFSKPSDMAAWVLNSEMTESRTGLQEERLSSAGGARERWDGAVGISLPERRPGRRRQAAAESGARRANERPGSLSGRHDGLYVFPVPDLAWGGTYRGYMFMRTTPGTSRQDPIGVGPRYPCAQFKDPVDTGQTPVECQEGALQLVQVPVTLRVTPRASALAVFPAASG